MYIVLLIHVGGVELHHRCSNRLHIQQAGCNMDQVVQTSPIFLMAQCALIRSIFRDDLTMRLHKYPDPQHIHVLFFSD